MEKMKYKGLCPQCQEDEIYSETLTHGLCLNCHYQNVKEIREMEIECEHDYYQGLLY